MYFAAVIIFLQKLPDAFFVFVFAFVFFVLFFFQFDLLQDGCGEGDKWGMQTRKVNKIKLSKIARKIPGIKSKRREHICCCSTKVGN